VIPEERSHLQVAATTHPGMKGKNNEDRYGVSAYRLDSDKRLPSALAIVSDGIGGHRAGEVAAQLAVEVISTTVANSNASDPPAILRDAISKASQAIHQQSEGDPSKKGMGATCACAWVIGNRLYTASVGDSRIYLIRGETIKKLSIDHTWIQEAIEFGALTPEQARGHPNAHVIRRYLGSPQPVTPDMRLRLRPGETDEQAEGNQGFRLMQGDCLLLCSDGLTDLVDDAEILAALKTENLEVALQKLVDLANERGGHDNITIVAMQAPFKKELEEVGVLPAAPKTRTRLPFTLSCLGIGALIVLGLVVVGGYALWMDYQSSLVVPPVTETITGTPFPTPTPPITPSPVPTEPTLLPGVTVTRLPSRTVVPPPSRPTITSWPTDTPGFLPIFPATPTPTTELP
jgi:PPM family protein phosphatase